MRKIRGDEKNIRRTKDGEKNSFFSFYLFRVPWIIAYKVTLSIAGNNEPWGRFDLLSCCASRSAAEFKGSIYVHPVFGD